MIIKAKEKKDLIEIMVDIGKKYIDARSDYPFIFKGKNSSGLIIEVNAYLNQGEGKYRIAGGVLGYKSITLEIQSKKYKKVIL